MEYRSNQGYGSTDINNKDEKRKAQITIFDQRLIIDDNHQPSYQDFVLVSKEYCSNHRNSATSDNANKKND